MKLRTIDEHAGYLVSLIAYSFDYLSGRDEWHQPLAHLNMAAGIKNIEYDKLRFDRYYNIGMGCSAADDASYAQNKFENKLIISLCRFNFIWSSLETIIDIVVPPKLITNPRGKVNNACFFLKHNIPVALSFNAYEEELNLLESSIIENSCYSEIIKDGLSYGDHVSNSGKGLFLTYKLRNKLVHGSLEIPMTHQEEAEEMHTDNYIVELSSRLVLYTIQMLCLIFWKDKFPTIEWTPYFHEKELDIYTAFTNIQYDCDLSDIPLQKSLFA